jgi:hypothetical protein
VWFIQQPKLGEPTKKRGAADELDVSGDDDDSDSEDSGDELPDEQSAADSDNGDAAPKRAPKKRPASVPEITTGKHAKVNKYANLLALVPRCGTMTKII